MCWGAAAGGSRALRKWLERAEGAGYQKLVSRGSGRALYITGAPPGAVTRSACSLPVFGFSPRMNSTFSSFSRDRQLPSSAKMCELCTKISWFTVGSSQTMKP